MSRAQDRSRPCHHRRRPRRDDSGSGTCSASGARGRRRSGRSRGARSGSGSTLAPCARSRPRSPRCCGWCRPSAGAERRDPAHRRAFAGRRGRAAARPHRAGERRGPDPAPVRRRAPRPRVGAGGRASSRQRGPQVPAAASGRRTGSRPILRSVPRRPRVGAAALPRRTTWRDIPKWRRSLPRLGASHSPPPHDLARHRRRALAPEPPSDPLRARLRARRQAQGLTARSAPRLPRVELARPAAVERDRPVPRGDRGPRHVPLVLPEGHVLPHVVLGEGP